MCTKTITKQLNWIDRPNYRPATEQDVHCGRSLKLRNTNHHQLFQCKKGFMHQYCSKQHKYILSQYNTDYNLFCVKYLP